MAIGIIRPPTQELPQPLPLPEDDMEYLEQRFQAHYYTPNGSWEVISIDWNTRYHRAVFIIGNDERDTIEVGRSYQINLREVLAIKGIVVHQIEMINLHGQNIPDANAILNQSIEDMQLVSATIWSHGGPYNAAIQPSFYQNLPEAAWEAQG